MSWTALFWILSCTERPAAPPSIDRLAGLMAVGVTNVSVTPSPVLPGDISFECRYNFHSTNCANPQDVSTFKWWLNGVVVPGATQKTWTASAPLVEGNEVTCKVFPKNSCNQTGTSVSDSEVARVGNILIVVLDDVGVDQLESSSGFLYEVGGGPKADVPTLDSIAQTGVVFNRAYGNPVCSPTRATIQTGRHSYRTGVTTGVEADDLWWLQDYEVTFAEMVNDRRVVDYDTSYIGKWHLVSNEADDPLIHPNADGWAYADVKVVDSEATDDFELWDTVVNGEVHEDITTYMTTYVFDEAFKRIDDTQQAPMEEPWILMIAPKPPHKPYHCPPPGLFVSACDDDDVGQDSSNPEMFRAALEAVDFELGEFVALMSPAQLASTTFIVVGDNGTFIDSIDNASGISKTVDRFKGTPYELGTRVPLIVAGPYVSQPGSRSDAFVQTTDIFATVAALAGVPCTAADPCPAEDSKSFLPWIRDPSAQTERTYVYSEHEDALEAPNPEFTLESGGHSVRDATYRLVHWDHCEYELYDLSAADSWEDVDLIADAGGLANLATSDPTAYTAYTDLKQKLEVDEGRYALPAVDLTCDPGAHH